MPLTTKTSISRLIELAKTIRPTESEREEQRRSFVYGNTALENDAVTRELVDRLAQEIKADL